VNLAAGSDDPEQTWVNGENGGECGYTLEVNPPPDDHTLDIAGSLHAVSPQSKLATKWGRIKISY